MWIWLEDVAIERFLQPAVESIQEQVQQVNQKLPLKLVHPVAQKTTLPIPNLLEICSLRFVCFQPLEHFELQEQYGFPLVQLFKLRRTMLELEGSWKAKPKSHKETTFSLEHFDHKLL